MNDEFGLYMFIGMLTVGVFGFLGLLMYAFPIQVLFFSLVIATVFSLFILFYYIGKAVFYVAYWWDKRKRK